MKTIFIQLIALTALVSTANAQVQMGANISSLTGHGGHDNHTTLTGATIFGQYFITGNMAVGAVIHAYSPKKTTYSNSSVKYTATDDVTNISTSFAVFLMDKASLIQPYVGVDLGISLSNHNIGYSNGMNKAYVYKIQQSYMMMSPKAGIDIGIANSLGVFTQVQYNYSPGDGNPSKVNLANGKSTYVLTTEPISKYFNIDAGVYLKLGNMKKVVF
jgi:hypothetical protein